MFDGLASFLTSTNAINVQETISFFKASCKQPVYNRDPIDKICAILPQLPDRDSFELHIEAGESLFKANRLPINSLALEEFVIDALEVGEIKVTLAITKNKVNNTISIYSLVHFEHYLLSSNLRSVLENLSSYLNGTLHFEVTHTTAEFNTQTLSFNERSTSSNTFVDGRETLIANIKESTSISGVSNLTLLPNDFHVRYPGNQTRLQTFFTRICGLLSLAYLSNVAELSTDGSLSVRMYGYKAVILNNVSDEYLIENSSMLYKIYRWVYDTDTVADRLGLARNVISLHLNARGVPVLSQAVWDAIHSNYQIYLKGNIESYLEVKGKIAELLLEAVAKTGQLAESLLDSLKNNALIIITFLLTVVVVNGIKDLSIAAFFSIPYLIVTLSLVASSWIWLILLRNDAEDRFIASSTALANVLRTNYGGVLLADEIDRSLQPAIAENQQQLKRQLDKYSAWWRCMLGGFTVLYFLSFAGYNIAESQKRKSSNVKSDELQKIPNRAVGALPHQQSPKKYIGPEM